MCSFPVAFILVVFEEREVDDPAEFIAWFDYAEVSTELASDSTHRVAALLPVVMCNHEDDVAVLGTRSSEDFLVVACEILRDTA